MRDRGKLGIRVDTRQGLLTFRSDLAMPLDSEGRRAVGVRKLRAGGSVGNMHFDAAAADSNGDHMISKDEFMKYGETMWERMARSASVSMPVVDAAHNFSRGNVQFDAKAMDANGDGMISKEEFMKYGESKFDHMKKDSAGMLSVADAARDIGSGNMHPDSK
ncbi:MAG: EF-hand domain-containing protein [Gammaproteobacteria bacterium]